MNPLSNIQLKFNKANIIEKIIYVNIAVFILVNLVGIFYTSNQGSLLIHWLGLPSDINNFLIYPWTLVTYGFVHNHFVHLIFNLIVLYYIGYLFLDYFSEKQLLTFYILGSIFGGFAYLGYYNLIHLGESIPLIGASAGIAAIFIGIATHTPNYALKLSLIGFVKLWVLAAIWLGINVVQLSGLNAGGSLAHLGGALFGYFSITYSFGLAKGNFSSIFKKKSPLKTAYKSTHIHQTQNTPSNQQQIDDILDKISKSGYESLSAEEKQFLFKQKGN